MGLKFEFNPNSHIVVPLTAALAAEVGHILWIEDDDPQRALRRMAVAAFDGPHNCAIWANAGDFIPEERKAAIRAWRKNFNCQTPQAVLDPKTAKDPTQEVSRLFNAAGKNYIRNVSISQNDWNSFYSGLKEISEQVIDSTAQLSQAFPETIITWKTRISKQSSCHRQLDVHTDGPNGNMNARFIQSVESPGTCLFDNAIMTTHPICRFNQRGQRNGGNIETLRMLQLPLNAMALMGREHHQATPIAHCEAPPPGAFNVRTPRTVFVYDLLLRSVPEI